MIESQEKIKKLANVAIGFWDNKTPSFTWLEHCEWKDSETGETHVSLPQKTGHWTALLDEVKGLFERPLTGEEITILSLSRDFGPTPALENEEAQELFQFLFSDRNSTGIWYEWDELGEALKAFLAGEQNPFSFF